MARETPKIPIDRVSDNGNSRFIYSRTL